MSTPLLVQARRTGRKCPFAAPAPKSILRASSVFICYYSSKGEIYVDFLDFNSSKYKGLRATFKRVSTASTATGDEKEPMRTQWQWYWMDKTQKWRMFELNEQVSRKSFAFN